MEREQRRDGGHKEVTQPAYDLLITQGVGFHRVESAAKRAILDRLRSNDRGLRRRLDTVSPTSFDLVKLPGVSTGGAELTAGDVGRIAEQHFSELTLIDVKATRRRLDSSLRGAFFSFQYAEQLAAQALQERYRIAFVAMNPRTGPPFYQLLSWNDLWMKARSVHLQFSVQF